MTLIPWIMTIATRHLATANLQSGFLHLQSHATGKSIWKGSLVWQELSPHLDAFEYSSIVWCSQDLIHFLW